MADLVGGGVRFGGANAAGAPIPQIDGGVAGGTLGKVLHEQWSPEVTSQFNNESLLMQILDDGATVEDWDGEYVVEPIHTGRNRAGGAGRETDDYPLNGTQGYDQMQIGTAFYRTGGQITSKGIKVAERGSKSAVKALQADISGGLRDLVIELGIDFYGTSWGLLGYVKDAQADVNLTLETDMGGANPAGARLAKMNGTRFLSGGRNQNVQICQVGDDNLVDAVRGAKATTVTSVTNRSTCVLAADLGAQAGDAVMRAPSLAGQNDLAVGESVRFAVVGLDEIYDDLTTTTTGLYQNYFQINRSTTTSMASHVRNLAGAALTEEVLQDFLDAIAEKSGEIPDCMITHRSVRTKLAQEFTGDRRFTPQEFPGGWKGEMLTYNPGDGDIHIYVDRLAPYRTLFAANKSYLKKFVLTPAHLVEYDGSSLRQQGNSPVWQWNVELDLNLACTKPNTGGKLIDIASDATFGVAGFLPEL